MPYIFAFLIAIWFGFSSSAQAIDDWSDQMVYQMKYFLPGSRSLAFDADGQPHVFYGGNRLVHAWHSNQDGQWHQEFVDSVGLTGGYTRAVRDAAGHFHVLYLADSNVYGETSGGDLIPPMRLRYATNKSGTWTTESLDWSPVDPWDIAVDAAGTPHAAYRDLDGNIHYTTRGANGWSDQIVELAPMPFFGGSHITDISLIFDSLGRAHLLYQNYTAKAFKHAYQNGGGWTVEVIDSMSNPTEWDFSYSALACDAAGHAHVAYVKSNVLYYATNMSGSWVTQTADADAYVPENVSITIDAAGHAGILFDDWQTYGSLKEMNYASNASGSWQAAVVDTIGNGAARTQLALAPDGTTHAIYLKQASLTSMALIDASLTAGGWTLDQIDQDENGPLSNPIREYGIRSNVIKDGAGALHVVYTRQTDGHLEYSTNESGAWVRQELPFGNSTYLTPRLALDAAGRLHLAFIPTGGGGTVHSVRTSGGWSFETITSLPLQDVAMAVDGDGYVHLAGIDNKDEVRYASNRSGTWQEETVQNVAAPQGYSRYDYAMGLSIDAAGAAHLGYTDGSGSLIAASNALGSWRQTTVASPEVNHLWNTPDIVVQADGTLHMGYVNFYCTFTCFNLGIGYGTNASGHWVEEVVDGTAYLDGTYMTESLNPSLALDASGNPHIAYTFDVERDSSVVEEDLRHASKVNGSWNVAEIATGQPMTGAAPRLFIDTAGRSYISYYNVVNSSASLINGDVSTPSFAISLSPSYLDFGLTYIGSGAQRTVTLTNLGTGATTIVGMAMIDADNIPGSGGGYFTVQPGSSQPCTTTAAFTLSAGASCTVNVAFNPAGNLQSSATLVVSGNADTAQYAAAKFLGTGEFSTESTGGGSGSSGSGGGSGGGGGATDPLLLILAALGWCARQRLHRRH